ncbi:MAG TPA: LON peptidase substrate-binding domain-containing protein [Pyrinomonadaceae bacterium]|jgi:Lon protease-like protein|nr:LON peptidase substrate-binding domain-containing protein [Pyrinomonadaceae bacterium]
MSESLEKVRGVRQLPIFPLPVILMPGEIIPLHIFEPRYRKMLDDVQAGNRLFGLSYFEPQESEEPLPPAGHFGCVAEVREVQPLEDGRSNIVITGIIRYRFDEYAETGEPYLAGEVTYFEDREEEDAEKLGSLSEEVTGLFKRVANAAHSISGDRTPMPELPDIAPQELSYLISAAFNFENSVKFELMKTRSTVKRLERLRTVLKKAVENIEETAMIAQVSKTNGHSKKKIDLDQ